MGEHKIHMIGPLSSNLSATFFPLRSRKKKNYPHKMVPQFVVDISNYGGNIYHINQHHWLNLTKNHHLPQNLRNYSSPIELYNRVLIQPCPFGTAVSTSAFWSNIKIQSLTVSDAFKSLTPTLPKGTAEVHFFPPAHSPHYPPIPAVNSSTLTAVFWCVHLSTNVFEKNDVLKKNDCSRRMRKVVFNPSKMQP